MRPTEFKPFADIFRELAKRPKPNKAKSPNPVGGVVDFPKNKTNIANPLTRSIVSGTDLLKNLREVQKSLKTKR